MQSSAVSLTPECCTQGSSEGFTTYNVVNSTLDAFGISSEHLTGHIPVNHTLGATSSTEPFTASGRWRGPGAFARAATDGYRGAMASRAALPGLVAATFLAGFGVAELTGVRALGGLVLLAGGVWCARIALRLAGPGATVTLVVIALALFVLSHPLGHVIGAWPAVAISAALVAAVAAALTRRTASRPAARQYSSKPAR
jgi:hypothetical protein